MYDKGRYGSFRLRMNVCACVQVKLLDPLRTRHVPYPSVSEVVFHEDALYQVYTPLPFYGHLQAVECGVHQFTK